MRVLSIFLSLFFLELSVALASDPSLVDGFVATVGAESVFYSDLLKFRGVDEVLDCAKLRHRGQQLSAAKRALLNVYIEEELVYQEARSKKFKSQHLVLQASRQIQTNPACWELWKKLGADWGEYWRSPTRKYEGESQLVMELEKRLNIDAFTKAEPTVSSELWRREVRQKFPVRVLID